MLYIQVLAWLYSLSEQNNNQRENIMTRKITALLATLLCVFGFASVAAAQDRTADHEAITELMWHYARALDTFNPDAYVSRFTEDGEFVSGASSTKGREALWDMIEGLRVSRAEQAEAGNPPALMYHMNTDVWVEFVDDTHARHHTYWITLSGANLIAAGVGVDHLVKIDGEWLIEKRDITQPE
jgi:hypothetical protein